MSSYDKNGEAAGRIAGAVVIIGVITLVITLYWGALHLIAPGTKYPYTFDRWEMAHFFTEGWNFFGGTPALWAWFAALAIIAAVWYGFEGTDDQQGAASLFAILSIAICLGFAMPGLISRDKVVGQFYQQATTWYVPDPTDVPSAITRLAEGGHKDEGGCAVKPIHDVPGCIKQGELPDTPGLWEGRNSSYNGARTVLNSSVATQQGADLMEASLTYLGGETADAGLWTGVIDGSGAYNSAKGVVTWNGKTQEIKKCLFGDKHTGTSDYKFNRAFDGSKGNSLSHLILSKYTGYMYETDDVWGYCDGVRPVIMVPMTKYVPFHHQVFKVPAGVLAIYGSETGDPSMTLHRNVTPGQFPGPVVAASLIERQRETLDWAAGRKYRKSTGGNNGGFGFEPASAETQAGNDSEYRLFNTVEKRWYFVTPLVPNNAKSQTYVGYALTATDEVHAGKLPELKVYIPNDDPAKQANADRLHSEALTYVGTNYPGFKTNGGELSEIVPLGGTMWRLYGEVKGYTILYIDVDSTFRVQPKVTELNGGTSTPVASPSVPTPSASPGAQKVCEKAVSAMTPQEKADCVKALVDSLTAR